MRGAVLSRLVLALAGPAFLLAALATGFAQRPSAVETAYVTYLWLGGDPSDLCGGHGPDHLHCPACQPPGTGVAAAVAGIVRLALPVRAAAETVASTPAPARRILRAEARGPPGSGLA